MYDVITVGSSTIDVFANTESELIKIKTAKQEEELIAYPSGSKILIKELNFTTGGGGTNTAVSMRKLGLKVAYLGKIGNDNNGKRILELLKKDKVDFVGAKGKEITGYSVILDSMAHDRTILTYKGCNNNLNFNEINLAKLKTKWFYSSSMMEKSFKTLEKLSDFAKKKHIKIAFNPSSYLAEKGKNYLKKVLSNTNILILNNEEASLLVGKETINSCLKDLRNLGPEIVVVTQGRRGATAFDGKYIYSIKSHHMKVVESTGAGDAFASSFLAGIIKKNDIKFALQLGLANAESVITHHGAKHKLLTWNEALKAIKKNPGNLSKKAV